MVDLVNIKHVSGGAAMAVAKSHADRLVKTGRWEIVPGDPILPTGCPAELAQRKARADAQAKVDAEKAEDVKAEAAKAIEVEHPKGKAIGKAAKEPAKPVPWPEDE